MYPVETDRMTVILNLRFPTSLLVQSFLKCTEIHKKPRHYRLFSWSN